jgi:beta-carotene ketolase (CrtW type)
MREVTNVSEVSSISYRRLGSFLRQSVSRLPVHLFWKSQPEKAKTVIAPPHMDELSYLQKVRGVNSWKGLVSATVLLLLWSAALITGLFYWDISARSVPATIALFLAQTYLYTGIFITAHDAMHLVVVPHHPRLNHFIGWLCVQLFAIFDYDLLVKAHWEHHKHTGQPHKDPDFHDGEHTGPVAWYFTFLLRNMQPVRQLGGMACFFWGLLLWGVPLENLLLLWTFPSLLSSVQLFYFGTYLVHRRKEDVGGSEISGFADKHNSRTLDLPAWVHLLLCYNFGLHHEHHLVPYAPWWKLPSISRELKEKRL